MEQSLGPSWEVVHAFTMIPGLFLGATSIRTCAYHMMCLSSFTYHIYKALWFEDCDPRVVGTLLRIDLSTQLLTCFTTAVKIAGKLMIVGLSIASTRLDVSDRVGKRTHIILNGLAILVATSGYGVFTLLGWLSVIAWSVVFNITKYNVFHSCMHLTSHVAYYLTL